MNADNEHLIDDINGWSDEWLIQAYVDGQLDASCVCRFEERLRGEPWLAEEVGRQMALKSLIQRDKLAMPPMPRIPREVERWCALAEAVDVAEPEGTQFDSSAGRGFGNRFHSFWNQPLVQAAALVVLVIGLVRLYPIQGVGDDPDAIASTAEILSLDLPQEGTGAYVYEQAESNLTVVWVTGLSDGGGVGEEPES